MTDELTTPAPKQMWTRCPACSTVMPNIQIAKDGHRLGNCPHDMQLKIQKLEDRIEALTGLVSGVSGHVESITAEPSVDLAGIADWDDEQEETAAHVTVQTSSIPIVPNPIVRSYLDEDDDEDLR